MQLRLIYFDFPFWRAEASRIALHLGGLSFEDVRPTYLEFKEMKASGELPYGQLPVLDVDGTRIAQSVAIARFCGKLSGLYPQNDALQSARVDELMDTASQVTQLLYPSMRERDPAAKAAMRQELSENDLPLWLGLLERRLEENTDSGFFVGQTMTIADLVIWRLVGWLSGGSLDHVPTTLLEPFPNLSAHGRLIDAQPGVRAWMDAHYAT